MISSEFIHDSGRIHDLEQNREDISGGGPLHTVSAAAITAQPRLEMRDVK